MSIVKSLLTALLSCFLATSALSQEFISDQLRQPALDAVKGKTVVFVPMAMSFDLPAGWAAVMQQEAKALGYKLDIRDSNWSTDTGNRAISQAIIEKPDVLVVQNPDVSSYARLLRRAEQAGIKVIQVNMSSTYQTSAFVGADFYGIGLNAAKRLAEVCGKSKGKSGKVAVIEGPVTAAASVFQHNGFFDGMKDPSEITVVSTQSADWDPSKARSITQTVIQQHPDLCGVVGYWDVMDAGTGAAIQESGRDIYLVTSGGGNETACQGLENGTFDEVISYDVPGQGRDINTAIKVLLQAQASESALKFSLYSPNTSITKETLNASSCWNLANLKAQ